MKGWMVNLSLTPGLVFLVLITGLQSTSCLVATLPEETKKTTYLCGDGTGICTYTRERCVEVIYSPDGCSDGQQCCRTIGYDTSSPSSRKPAKDRWRLKQRTRYPRRIRKNKKEKMELKEAKKKQKSNHRNNIENIKSNSKNKKGLGNSSLNGIMAAIDKSTKNFNKKNNKKKNKNRNKSKNMPIIGNSGGQQMALFPMETNKKKNRKTGKARMRRKNRKKKKRKEDGGYDFWMVEMEEEKNTMERDGKVGMEEISGILKTNFRTKKRKEKTDHLKKKKRKTEEKYKEKKRKKVEIDKEDTKRVKGIGYKKKNRKKGEAKLRRKKRKKKRKEESGNLLGMVEIEEEKNTMEKDDKVGMEEISGIVKKNFRTKKRKEKTDHLKKKKRKKVEIDKEKKRKKEEIDQKRAKMKKGIGDKKMKKKKRKEMKKKRKKKGNGEVYKKKKKRKNGIVIKEIGKRKKVNKKNKKNKRKKKTKKKKKIEKKTNGGKNKQKKEGEKRKKLKKKKKNKMKRKYKENKKRKKKKTKGNKKKKNEKKKRKKKKKTKGNKNKKNEKNTNKNSSKGNEKQNNIMNGMIGKTPKKKSHRKCKTNKKCKKFGGKCKQPSFCKTQSIYGLCKKGTCSCCIVDKQKDASCAQRVKKKCLKYKGTCKTSCSANQRVIPNGCKKQCQCCAKACKIKPACREVGGFCVGSKKECPGGKTDKKLCKGKKCLCCFSGSICSTKTKKNCLKYNGSCKDTCKSSDRVIANGCKGKSCKCCAKPCKIKESCTSAGGWCVSRKKDCTSGVIDKKGCKGKKCICCLSATGGGTGELGGAIAPPFNWEGNSNGGGGGADDSGNWWQGSIDNTNGDTKPNQGSQDKPSQGSGKPVFSKPSAINQVEGINQGGLGGSGNSNTPGGSNSNPSGNESGNSGNSNPSANGSNNSGNSKPSGNGSNNSGNSKPSGNGSGNSGNSKPSGNGSNNSGNSKPSGNGSGNSGNSKPSGNGSGNAGNSKPSGNGSGNAGNSKPSGNGSGNAGNSNPKTTKNNSGSNGNKTPSPLLPFLPSTSNVTALRICKENVSKVIPQWILQLKETYVLIEDFIRYMNNSIINVTSTVTSNLTNANDNNSVTNYSTSQVTNALNISLSITVERNNSFTNHTIGITTKMISNLENSTFDKSTSVENSNLTLLNASSLTPVSNTIPVTLSSPSTLNINIVNSTIVNSTVEINSTPKNSSLSSISNINFVNFTVSGDRTTRHNSTSFSTIGNNNSITPSNNIEPSNNLIETGLIKNISEPPKNSLRNARGIKEQHHSIFESSYENEIAVRNRNRRKNRFGKLNESISKRALNGSSEDNMNNTSGNGKPTFVSYDIRSRTITIKGNANISWLIINYNNGQKDNFSIDISNLNIGERFTETKVTGRNMPSYVKNNLGYANWASSMRNQGGKYMIHNNPQNTRYRGYQELKTELFPKEPKMLRFSKLLDKNSRIVPEGRGSVIDSSKHTKTQKEREDFGSKRNGKAYQKSGGIIFEKESGNLIIPINNNISTIVISNGDHTSLIIINADNTITFIGDYIDNDISLTQNSSYQNLFSPSTSPVTQGMHHTLSSLVSSNPGTEKAESRSSKSGKPTQPIVITAATLRTTVPILPVPPSKETPSKVTTALPQRTKASPTQNQHPTSQITTEKVIAPISFTKLIFTEKRPSPTILGVTKNEEIMPQTAVPPPIATTKIVPQISLIATEKIPSTAASAITLKTEKLYETAVPTAMLITEKLSKTTEQGIVIDAEKDITTKAPVAEVIPGKLPKTTASATTAVPEKDHTLPLPTTGIAIEKLPNIPVHATTLAINKTPKTIIPAGIVSSKVPTTTSRKFSEASVTIPPIVFSIAPGKEVTKSTVPESMGTEEKPLSKSPWVTIKATQKLQMTADAVISIPWKPPELSSPVPISNQEKVTVSSIPVSALTKEIVPLTKVPNIIVTKDKKPSSSENALASLTTDKVLITREPTMTVAKADKPQTPDHAPTVAADGILKSTIHAAPLMTDKAPIAKVTTPVFAKDKFSKSTAVEGKTTIKSVPSAVYVANKVTTPSAVYVANKITTPSVSLEMTSKPNINKPTVPVAIVTKDKIPLLSENAPVMAVESIHKSTVHEALLITDKVLVTRVPTVTVAEDKKPQTPEHAPTVAAEGILKSTIHVAPLITDKAPIAKVPTPAFAIDKVSSKTTIKSVPSAVYVANKVTTPSAVSVENKMTTPLVASVENKVTTPSVPIAMASKQNINKPTVSVAIVTKIDMSSLAVVTEQASRNNKTVEHVDIDRNPITGMPETVSGTEKEAEFDQHTEKVAEMTPPVRSSFTDKESKSEIPGKLTTTDRILTEIPASSGILSEGQHSKSEITQTDQHIEKVTQRTTPVQLVLTDKESESATILGEEMVHKNTLTSIQLEGNKVPSAALPPATESREKTLKTTVQASGINAGELSAISMNPAVTIKNGPKEVVNATEEFTARSTLPLNNLVSLDNSTMISSDDDLKNFNVSTTIQEKANHSESNIQQSSDPLQGNVQVINTKESVNDSVAGLVTPISFLNTSSNTSNFSTGNTTNGENNKYLVPMAKLESLLLESLRLTETVKSLANNRLPVSSCPTNQIRQIVFELVNNYKVLQRLDKLSMNITELLKIKASILNTLSGINASCIKLTGNFCLNNVESTMSTASFILNSTTIINNNTIFPQNISSGNVTGPSQISTSRPLNNSVINDIENITKSNLSNGSNNSTIGGVNRTDNPVINNTGSIISSSSDGGSINSTIIGVDRTDNTVINNTGSIINNSSDGGSINSTIVGVNRTDNPVINNTGSIINNSSDGGSINSTIGGVNRTDNPVINNTGNIISNSSDGGSINSTIIGVNRTDNPVINNTGSIISNSSDGGSINSTIGGVNMTDNTVINNTGNIISNSPDEGSINSTIGGVNRTDNTVINNTGNIISNSSDGGSINSTIDGVNRTDNTVINNTDSIISNSSDGGSINSTIIGVDRTDNTVINNTGSIISNISDGGSINSTIGGVNRTDNTVINNTGSIISNSSDGGSTNSINPVINNTDNIIRNNSDV
ncbi:uncharacterized protein [Palaemon carinicauda]|uniref:uncharacterized protein n=1 Tax=Palaemon carinicauda TaxID=392227 RepID=UPI0035B5DF68